MNSKLGKLVAVHPTSPAFLQRAAIVAALSFLFFLAALILYLVWQNFLYFVLATGFLIVQIFTMIGWWMQKRNAVSIYANGLVYRRRSILWSEIADVETLNRRRPEDRFERWRRAANFLVDPKSRSNCSKGIGRSWLAFKLATWTG